MPSRRSGTSEGQFSRAKRLIPGGVNSPVRAFGAVGGTPPFIASGRGAHVVDVSGKTYLDYIGSWGPLILGHAHPVIVRAATRAAREGTSFGIPTVREVDLAALLVGAIPSMEMVRLVNSGTEACMTAIRLARAFTKRSVIVKFAGGYHGHADGLLVKAGSGAATFGVPTSPGVPASFARETVVLPYNDGMTVRKFFHRHGEKIAGVIVEPVAGNMGLVPPVPGFLRELRLVTEKFGSLLIFDEVITGFRFSFGGAQDLLGVEPDLTVLGKIIGGGFPVGAFGGPREIMNLLAPVGPVYQAGTLSGNPVAVAAGLAQLEYLRDHPEVYERMDKLTERLADGLSDLPGTRIHRAGSLMTLFFHRERIVDFNDAARADGKKFARFHRCMFDAGILLPPSPFEAWFVSAAHKKADIDRTIKAARSALSRKKR